MLILNFQIVIEASVQKVWNTMINQETYKQWTRVFQPTSYYEGNWEQGSEIKFLAHSDNGTQSGMYSRIKENKLYQYISIQHLGMISNGIVDTTSESVTKWAPSLENYRFNQLSENQTELKIEMEMLVEYKEMFDKLWPKALLELKNLCES